MFRIFLVLRSFLLQWMCTEGSLSEDFFSQNFQKMDKRKSHQDKQFVVLIFQSGAIKPPQKKRAKRNDVSTRAPVKPQMMKNHAENMMEIFVSLINTSNVTVSSLVAIFVS